MHRWTTSMCGCVQALHLIVHMHAHIYIMMRCTHRSMSLDITCACFDHNPRHSHTHMPGLQRHNTHTLKPTTHKASSLRTSTGHCHTNTTHASGAASWAAHEPVHTETLTSLVSISSFSPPCAHKYLTTSTCPFRLATCRQDQPFCTHAHTLSHTCDTPAAKVVSKQMTFEVCSKTTKSTNTCLHNHQGCTGVHLPVIAISQQHMPRLQKACQRILAFVFQNIHSLYW
jgi:hypothetical protein